MRLFIEIASENYKDRKNIKHLHHFRAIAETGVDRISVGTLTHSVTALDISMRIE